jgi:hypothetical protein
VSDRRVDAVDGFAISLEISAQQALFLLLAKDGTVNRMGSGALPIEDGDLYIGRAIPSLLPAALTGLSDHMLQFTGGYDVSDKQGAPCRLSITLRFADGTEDGFGFTYGSESQGPPREIAEFVQGAVVASDGWYREQQRIVRSQTPPAAASAKPWWRFW